MGNGIVVYVICFFRFIFRFDLGFFDFLIYGNDVSLVGKWCRLKLFLGKKSLILKEK